MAANWHFTANSQSPISMNNLLFSVFYPHSHRCRLVKSAMLPFIARYQPAAFTCFFSLYKGENVTISCHTDQNDESLKSIKEHFYRFFETYKAQQPPTTLPTNQLFLDFPHNTLYFWQKNPFQTGGLPFGFQRNQDYYTSLSLFCLNKLSGQSHWTDTLTFNVFVELLTVLKYYVRREFAVDAVLIFDQLAEGVKNRAGERAELVDRFLEEGRLIYRERKLAIDRHFDEVNRQMEMPGVVEGPVADWLNIIRKKEMRFSGDPPGNRISAFVKDLVLEVGARIDLSQKGLIQAIALMSAATKASKAI